MKRIIAATLLCAATILAHAQSATPTVKPAAPPAATAPAKVDYDKQIADLEKDAALVQADSQLRFERLEHLEDFKAYQQDQQKHQQQQQQYAALVAAKATQEAKK